MPKFSACGGLYAYCKWEPCVKRGCLILGGRSPPQAEKIAIWDPLNADFQWENEPPEAKIWAKSGPEAKEASPLVKDQIDPKGGVFTIITPDC